MPYRPTVVVRNAAQCLDCGDIIESIHRHNFVSCSCGNIFVDGGFDYVRMGWHNDNWIDMSVTYEGPETLWPWEVDTDGPVNYDDDKYGPVYDGDSDNLL